MHHKEIIEQVNHYQRSIEKCWEDEKRMLHCISKLYRLPITVQHLRDTGVGRTVNSLRKYEGGVGDAAKALVAKWKTMVANEDSSDETDEACVPDAPESYSPESPKRDGPSENGSSTPTMQDSKERPQSKSSKSGSSSRGTKHSSKNSSSSGVISNKNSEKHSVHKDKHSKPASKEHESKSKKHSSKHDSDSDNRTKNSKVLSEDSDTGHNLKNKSRNEEDVCKVFNNSESINLKRKEEREDDIQPNKKRKYSESQGEVDSTRLVASSPIVSESESPRLGCESRGSVESSRKEENGKDRRDREKDSSKHKARSEGEKESHKSKDSKSDEKRKSDSHRSSKHSSKSKSSHGSHSSSSSSKNTTKHSDSAEDKEKKSRKESRSECKDKLKKKDKKEKDEDVVGIDSQSGTSFADALGMCAVFPPSRKRGGASSSTSSGKPNKLEPGTSSEMKPISTAPKTKSESGTDSDSDQHMSILVDLAATLPKVSPNYKPLPYNTNPVNRKFEEDKSLSEVIYSKNQRTKVFSGNKTGMTSLPTLYELCIRVLIENIDALEVTGGVPFYILKPVLERANPDQLFMLEHHNPYLIEDTDSLWEFHCNREFRTKKREEMESWREMYMRCLDEREAKLKALTANIKQSIDKSAPARSTIQVHDNFHMKPPRNVLRQQVKYGTARDLPVTSSELKRKLITGAVKPTPANVCPPSAISRLKTTSSMGKKTKAPLMAKALQLVKGRYKR